MYALIWKKPVAIRDGKSGYVMTWRGKQLAICEDTAPLEDIIRSYAPQDRERFYIEALAH